MNLKKVCILVSGLLISAETRQLTTQPWPYCDQWNKCSSSSICYNKQCVPKDCVNSESCASGFQCVNSQCVSTTYAQNNGGYCDQWTACPSGQQCSRNKCVPLDCRYETDCVAGFSCSQNKCIATDYSGSTLGFCDQYTKCPSTHQCVNKICVPLTCTRTPDCIVDYVCYSGSCIQINNNHTRGRYCDAEHECDTLHVCRDSQCFWK